MQSRLGIFLCLCGNLTIELCQKCPLGFGKKKKKNRKGMVASWIHQWRLFDNNFCGKNDLVLGVSFCLATRKPCRIELQPLVPLQSRSLFCKGRRKSSTPKKRKKKEAKTRRKHILARTFATSLLLALHCVACFVFLPVWCSRFGTLRNKSSEAGVNPVLSHRVGKMQDQVP